MDALDSDRQARSGRDSLSKVLSDAEDDLPAGSLMTLLLALAHILFVNGQTTERVVDAVEELARCLGVGGQIFPQWGELRIRLAKDGQTWHDVAPAIPAGVDMRRVAEATALVDDFRLRHRDLRVLRSALARVAAIRSVSTFRFASMAGAGAAALAVIFGAHHPFSLVLIAASASLGAILRRWLSRLTGNLLVQPFSAALLSGMIGALAVHSDPGVTSPLVALCPCMVLVPGPHILNGLLDAARGRLTLAISRLSYAALVVVAICTGLLLGLALGGTDLPISGQSAPVELPLDMLAAGVAVAAYGTFFGTPWRMLPLPILAGMGAHACHWLLVARWHASTELAAFATCLIIGAAMSPSADRLRLPFAGIAFACVVSLMPGIFLFRMAGGLVRLASARGASIDTLLDTASDAATALLVIVAMATGLITPRLVLRRARPART